MSKSHGPVSISENLWPSQIQAEVNQLRMEVVDLRETVMRYTRKATEEEAMKQNAPASGYDASWARAARAIAPEHASNAAIKKAIGEMRTYLGALEAAAYYIQGHEFREWSAMQVETARGSIDNIIARAIVNIETRGKAAA